MKEPSTNESTSLPKKRVLSDETILALEDLARFLQPIFNRMKKQGYRMVDGVIVPPKNHEEASKQKQPKRILGNQEKEI